MFTEEDFEEARLEQKEYGSLPQRIMMKRWEDCGRDVFKFWDSIEWDSSWLRHDTEEEKKLKEIAMTLMETTKQIPTDIDWIIQVEGHTDKRPINTAQFPSNWELSTARANSVLKLLLDIGFSPKRLAAAGYGEFYPISEGETKEDYQQNRRIELKITQR